jgi:hypothetical protein
LNTLCASANVSIAGCAEMMASLTRCPALS